MALDVRVLDENGEEIDLKQNFDDDNDILPQPAAEAEYGMSYSNDAGIDDDYTSDSHEHDDSENDVVDDYGSDSENTGFSIHDSDADDDEITGFNGGDSEPEDLV